MNEISIHGNLGRNPECTYTASGVAIAKFSVAVSSRRFDKNRGEWVSRPTVWHDVVAFGKLAENAADTLTKGTTVTVAGTLADDSYTRESREPGGEDIVIRRTQLEAFDIAVSLRTATAKVTRNERHTDETATAPTGR